MRYKQLGLVAVLAAGLTSTAAFAHAKHHGKHHKHHVANRVVFAKKSPAAKKNWVQSVKVGGNINIDGVWDRHGVDNPFTLTLPKVDSMTFTDAAKKTYEAAGTKSDFATYYGDDKTTFANALEAAKTATSAWSAADITNDSSSEAAAKVAYLARLNAYNNAQTDVDAAGKNAADALKKKLKDAKSALAKTKKAIEGLFVKDSNFRFDVSSVNLTFDAPVGKMLDMHAGLISYMGQGNQSGFGLDEAYVDLHEFASVPVSVRVGKGYVPFGQSKDHFPMTYSLTQLLSQINTTALQVAYKDHGVKAVVYGMMGNKKDTETSSVVESGQFDNFGVYAGYHAMMQGMKVNAGLGWVRDMSASSVGSELMTKSKDSHGRTAGMTAHVAVAQGPFDASADYVGAFLKVEDNAADKKDATKKHTMNDTTSAYGVGLGYRFDIAPGHSSRVGLGYQAVSKQFLSAKSRVTADYTVSVNRYADVALQFVHATPASTLHYANNRIGVRLGVHF